MKKDLENIKGILDLFLSQTNRDGVVSQERIKWELDFRSHLLNEIETIISQRNREIKEMKILFKTIGFIALLSIMYEITML